MTTIHIHSNCTEGPDTTILQPAQAGSGTVPTTCLDTPGPKGAQKQEPAREELKVPYLVQTRIASRICLKGQATEIQACDRSKQASAPNYAVLRNCPGHSPTSAMLRPTTMTVSAHRLLGPMSWVRKCPHGYPRVGCQVIPGIKSTSFQGNRVRECHSFPHHPGPSQGKTQMPNLLVHKEGEGIPTSICSSSHSAPAPEPQ